MDTGDVRAKFEAFGWDAVEIDGHDMAAIVEALERSRTLDRPAAIVCQTKKGTGVSAMEGRFGFHGKPPSPEQAAEALEELEARWREQSRLERGSMRKPRPSRPRPATPTATPWSSSARRTTTSSRSTPTSPSRPSRSSSASASPSASSTAAPPRRT